jgi:hypothetical protein
MADKPIDKKEIEELRRLLKLLGQEMNAVDFDNLIKSGAGAKTLLNSLRKEVEEFTSDIGHAASGFRKIIGEINGTNEGIKLANKSFNKLASITDKIQYHQQNISKLSLKEVQTSRKQIEQERIRLKTSNDLLGDKIAEINQEIKLKTIEKDRLLFKDNKTKEERRQLRDKIKEIEKNNKELSKTEAAQRNIQGILEDEDVLFGDTYVTLNKINKELEEEKKKLGLTGALLEGLNQIPFLNGVIDANEALDAAKEKIAEGGGRFEAMSAALGTVGKQIKTHLTDPAAVGAFVVTQIVDAFTSVDSAIGDLAKNFGISYNQAAGVSSKLNDAANSSYLLNVTTQGLTEAFTKLNNQFGTFAMISNEALESFTRLTKEAGLSDEAASALFKTSILTGKEVEATTKEFLGESVALAATNGIALNQKQILESVKDISAATLLSLGGQPAKLAKAVVQAKMLGTDLAKVEEIAGSLLDFESSIANELSAELITGKDLNLERARLAAINNDMATVAEEIAKQIGSAADFTKMNVIQQEALAKSVGMTKDDLAKSLMEREAMAKLSGQEGATAKEKFNNLVKEVGLEEAKRQLGDDQLANMMAGQSIQERLTATVEKLKEVFVSLVEPLMPILDVFANIMGYIAPAVGLIGTALKYTIQWGKYLLPIYGIYKGIQLAQKVGLTQSVAQYSISKLQKAEDMGINAVRLYRNKIDNQGLLTKLAYNAQLLIGLIREQGITGIKTFALTLDDKSIAKKIILGVWNLKDMIVSKASAFWEMRKNLGLVKAIAKLPILLGLKTAEAAIATETAAATVVATEAVSFGGATAWILAGLGAVMGGLAAYAMSDGKIDYNRGPVVSGGFGSVQLSPKDTGFFNGEQIIAGTNLGGGKSNSASQQDNSALVAEMRAMRQETSRANSKPTVVENSMNGTKFGTAVAMNTYKIQ